jgi:hypothetical protein
MRERVSTRVASYGNPHLNCQGVKVLTHNAVEEFRPGYPRYTALLSAHPSFHNFRRFTRTRLRLLLLKQDEIAVLEESLDKIDSAEECELFLGCRRRDANPARQEILRQLKLSLTEYGIASQAFITWTASDQVVKTVWWTKIIEAYHSQNPARGTSKI